MKRKLIQLAGKTMVVSIPKSFVDKYNLKKSEEVDVVEDNGQLKILTKNEITGKKSIEVEDTEFLSEQIDILYTCGFDQIRIKVTKKDSIDRLQKILAIADFDYELFVTGKNSCTLQSIRRIDAEQFDNVLRRIFYMLSMDEDIPNLKNQAARLIDTAIRMLHKKGYKNHNSTIFMSQLLMTLKLLAKDDIPFIRDIYSLFYNYKENQRCVPDN